MRIQRTNPESPACVISFLLAVFFTLAIAGPAFAEATAKQVSGRVEIGLGDPPDWHSLSAGDSIAENARIRTGSDGRVEIAMEAGTLRVHENSLLKLPSSTSDADRVDLDQGNSLFDVIRRAGKRFEVHTPTVVVSVKGTRFGVDASSETGEVAVYRGVVGVRQAGSAETIETLVRKGFLAIGGAGHPIELSVAPQGDPWARWQDNRREMSRVREKPSRKSDIERARRTMYESTTGDVIRRAAERKPEVAERLRKMRNAKRDETSGDDGTNPQGKGRAKQNDSMPAAPLLTPGAKRRDQRRGAMEMDGASMKGVVRDQQQTIQEQMRRERLASDIDSITGANGGGMASILSQLDKQTRRDVLRARQQAIQNAAGSPGSPFSQPGFGADWVQGLIDRGYDSTTANDLVDSILNP